jgi:hypothetical protein
MKEQFEANLKKYKQTSPLEESMMKKKGQDISRDDINRS